MAKARKTGKGKVMNAKPFAKNKKQNPVNYKKSKY